MFPGKLSILLFKTAPKYAAQSFHEARQKCGRGLLVLCAVSFIGLGLSACGFKPLYAEGNTPGQSSLFSKIQIQHPSGAGADNDLSREVYNALAKTLKSRGTPAYRLDIIAEGNDIGALMDANSREARTRFTLNLRYTLYDVAAGKNVTGGTTSATTSFNVDVNEYANLIALESAQSRTTQSAAQKIVLKLSNWYGLQAQK